MMAIHKILVMTILFQTYFIPLALADDSRACFYLDKIKIKNEIISLVFKKAGTLDKVSSVCLEKNGLFQGNKKLCSWSLNGGSGTKEKFSLDGNFAVPILESSCESPFSHQYTGIGFGDWYLTLCGNILNENICVRYREEDYCITIDSLKQWTRYAPEEFPIKGDEGD